MSANDVGSGSLRYNSNKVRMTYIPPSVAATLNSFCNINEYVLPVNGLVKLAEHYSLGSAKYPDMPSVDGYTFPNWAKGQNFDSMLLNSILRHTYAYISGEQKDTEFGSHHLTAVAWGLCALYHQFENYELYRQYDDRMWLGFKPPVVDEHDILSVLSYVQTSTNHEYILQLLIKQLYDVLVIIESESASTLSFYIDSERLNKIKSQNYEQTTEAS